MALIFMNNLDQNNEVAESKNLDTQIEKKSFLNNKQTKAQPNVKEKNTSEEVIEISHEPIVTIFDNDPIVDKEIIAIKFKHCSQLLYFLKDNKYKNKWSHSYEKLKKDNSAYYEKHLNQCIKVNKEHPEYGIEENKKLDSFQPSSYLGRLMSDDTFAEDEFEYNQDLIREALMKADPNLLLSFYSMIAYFKFIPDLEFTLGSQQHDYRAIIGEYAQILFACRLGADCGEFSSIVFEKCMLNSDMCSNSIEELIKTKFSQGQQADIELAYQHLVDYYDINEN